MKTYLVGGAVRDQMLNRPVKERDWVVVGATPEAMLKANFKQVGKDFPVFLHPHTKEEYALARTERKSGPGYTGFNCYAAADVTLEDDLKRRDLTVNAMAQDSDGNIIDPFNGQQDLKKRLLRHVSPAFNEDPLRILRTARFAARYAYLGFTVAQETIKLMRDMVNNGEVSHLVPERVWKEMETALGEQSPHVFFQVLRDCGALQVILPELDKLFGIPQPPEHHPEIDTGIHSLLAVKQAAKLSDSTAIRFAALVHDLGKGETAQHLLPMHIGHEQRSVDLINQLCDRIRVPNEARDLAIIVGKYHTHCHRALELKASTTYKTLEALDAFRREPRFLDFLFACEADAKGRTGLETKPYPQAEYLRKALTLCNNIKAEKFIKQGITGKDLGEVLKQKRIESLKQLTGH